MENSQPRKKRPYHTYDGKPKKKKQGYHKKKYKKKPKRKVPGIAASRHRYYKKHRKALIDRARRYKLSTKDYPYTKVLIAGKEYDAYSVGELARRLGRKAQTIRKWDKDGVIPPTFRDPKGCRVYLKEHVDGIVRISNECKITKSSSLEKTGFIEKVALLFRKVNASVMGEQI